MHFIIIILNVVILLMNFDYEFKFIKCIFKCTLLLLSDTRAHLLSFEEGSCYILSNRNNYCESLASYGVIFQRHFQPFTRKLEKFLLAQFFLLSQYYLKFFCDLKVNFYHLMLIRNSIKPKDHELINIYS